MTKRYKIDPKQKRELVQVLLAYIQEFGAEHVKVYVPEAWREFGMSKLGPIELKWCQSLKVHICASFGTNYVYYEVELEP